MGNSIRHYTEVSSHAHCGAISQFFIDVTVLAEFRLYIDMKMAMKGIVSNTYCPTGALIYPGQAFS